MRDSEEPRASSQSSWVDGDTINRAGEGPGEEGLEVRKELSFRHIEAEMPIRHAHFRRESQQH